MADINKLVPIVLLWESPKYVNNPNDNGGPTKFGITLGTWQSCGYDKNHDGHIDAEDIKILTPDDYQFVLRKYWNVWKADNIVSQSIANILVDWVWASGACGIKIPQRILGKLDDGIVGSNTLTGVNTCDQQWFFNEIHKARLKFVDDLCKAHTSQEEFRHGWENRINYFKYIQ